MVDATDARVGPVPRRFERAPGTRTGNFFLQAFPLMPARGTVRGTVMAAGDRWTFDRSGLPVDSTIVVWGHPPLRSGTPFLAAVRFAAGRERALLRLRLRPPASLPRVAIHRLPPPRLGGGRIRAVVRAALLGGAMVELSGRKRPTRVVDAVVSAATLAPGRLALRPGSGGTAVVRARVAEGRDAVVRIAPVDSPADPAHASRGLQNLAVAEIPAIPRFLRRGTTAGATWTVETALPGRRPRRLTPGLLREATHLCSQLPRPPGPPGSLAHDLELIAARLPDHSEALRRTRTALSGVVASLPAVLRHGDLWAGNLLVRRGHLCGVVDWDAWHPSGVPGADPLQLFATDVRLRARSELGPVWITRPWRSPSFLEATEGYWIRLDVRPAGEVLDAIGVAWWATEVAGTLSRLPERADDEDWVRTNVDLVLAALDR